MGYYGRILRGAQSQFVGTIAARDAVNWNAVMDSLMTTGTALAGGMTYTLASGTVTAAAFNPAALGGGNTLKGRFKSTNLALAADAPVSTWADASGNANDATQVGSARPVFKTNVQNARPGVLFTAASSQFMAANGLAAVKSGTDLPATVIIAYRHVTVAANQCYASWGSSSSVNPFGSLDATVAGSTVRWNLRDDALAQKFTAGGVFNTSAHVASFVHTGTLGSVYIDGATIASGVDLDLGAMTFNRFSLGCFGRTTNTTFMDGYLFEGLIYAAALSTEDRQTAERSLGSEWGITVA